MITFIEGQLREFSSAPPRVVVVAGGIGYEVNLPAYMAEVIQSRGQDEGTDIALEIYYHVTERQPCPYLVGFASSAEREFFTQLIEVEGIGPSKAVIALVVPPSEVATAIETGDASKLTSLPGIGSRAAQKMIATLKGKIKISPSASVIANRVEPVTEAQQEAIQGLISLGYRSREAQRAIGEAILSLANSSASAEDLLREVFKLGIKGVPH